MSFIDVNKLVDQAAEKIVLKVSQNLTEQADVFVGEIKKDLLQSVDKASVDIIDGFDQIALQLQQQITLIYIILALQIFIFFYCGYAAMIYLIQKINTPPLVVNPPTTMDQNT